MSLVAASGLSLAHGPKAVLDGASFTVGRHDRIGLVGPNGSGKSSLLRILAGRASPDAGALAWARGARCGYLPQDVAGLPEGPLLETVLASVPGRSALEARLAAAEAELAAARDEGEQLELSQALADLHAELDHFEERYGRRHAERILAGLGFPGERLARSTAELSGGWRTRAALAGILLQDPDLLLLDEPTNHLDVPTLEWFEEFLRGTRKALLLVSHDREFLNRQIDRVLSLEPEGLRAWTGDYDDYRRQREEEGERLAARARRQESRRAELETFIERFGAKATKARQARSKRRLLERMEEVAVRAERAALRFRFPDAPRPGREVLRLDGVGKAFGPKVVYRSLDASVLRGERVAIIGPNGAGKTTLLRLAAGELAPDAGSVRLGHAVVAGYYAQHHFDPAERGRLGLGGDGPAGSPRAGITVLDALRELAPDRNEAWLRGVAGAFLFSGDDAEKSLAVLSGGERARVALARLLLVPSNLLLLDEPTNHLDLESSEALAEALRGYQGTLLFVSHNKSFVNQLATRVWEVRDAGVLPFPGNLDDWLYHQRRIAGGPAAPPPAAAPAGAGGRARERERRRLEAEARARARPVRDEIARLEARIAELEREEREATAALAEPALYADFARARPLVEARSRARSQLEPLYAEWERQQGLLAALEEG